MQPARYGLLGQCDKVDIVRKVPSVDPGGGLYLNTATILYSQIPCRVFDGGNRRTQLAYHTEVGIDKEEAWQLQTSPAITGVKITDFARIYFGTQPNIETAEGITPATAPPQILLAEAIMTWDGSGWQGGGRTLQFTGGVWVFTITGVSTYSFEDRYGQDYDVTKLDWVSRGLSIANPLPGPYQDYQILKLKHHYDACGLLHHSQVWLEKSCVETQDWRDNLDNDNWQDNLFSNG